MKIFVIIPSGGSGIRAGSTLPKQYMQFGGKELIAYTIDVFQQCGLIDEITISAQTEFLDLLKDIKEKFSFTKIKNIVEGGIDRQHSVFNALTSLNASEDDLIIVHDAVRPLLPAAILIKSIETAKEFGSAVVAIKARDTLVRGSGSVISYAEREEFYYVQTPQVFRYKILLEAMRKSMSDNFMGTDESMLVHRMGHSVKIVDGSFVNFKITCQDDIKLFRLIAENKGGV
ncbi:MAG: 2-C-methyl-D-erythritol 4-phosphate cytidylyltransferase [Ignavibacteriae bacterium HGW-Ignavibacteriae-3]|nr:MAG: 2-C-methyl-D-erythritol 4-phosphate cytidylyltransferase [Ignavibacteriae bacterium HGW-Ignavibacteriae-3]